MLVRQTAQFIAADKTQRKLLSHAGGSDLYYKSSPEVSSGSKDGTLKSGESAVTFSAGVWVISASQTTLDVQDVTETADPTGKDLATQAELDAATTDIAVVKEAPINVEYPEYGADGTGVALSDAAFQAAIEALPASGGEIFTPRQYKLSEQLSFDDTRSVKLVGVSGGPTSGSSATSQLLFTQAGTDALISARSTGGFSMSNLQIEYSSGSYTGALLDLSHSEAESDAAYGSFEACHFAGLAVRSAMGVNLDKAIHQTFRGCYFQNFDIAARGQASKGRYSNSIHFDSCVFAQTGTVPLKNAGEAWRVNGCTFENLNSGAAGAYTSDSEVLAAGLTFDTCWFGDATKVEGTWITFRGKALNVRGGSLGSGALGVSVPDETSDVIVVQGVRFTTITDAIRLNKNAHFQINPNGYVSISGKKVSLDNGTTDAGEGILAS